MIQIGKYRVRSDQKVQLSDWDSNDDGGLANDAGIAAFKDLQARFVEQTEILYAENRRSLLVVFQGMDTSGKDSSTRAMFRDVSPTGIRATSFKAPSAEELSHDFLWRIHRHAPGHGEIAIFNRSHYEDVLIVRVKQLVPESRWKKRYAHIREFEQMLADEGTIIIKFYLHISREYQKERLQKRLEKPEKRWKFNPADLVERERWNDYMAAYEEALARCSTPDAPWYVVPSERRWFRDLLMTSVLVDTLEKLNMRYPMPTFDPTTIVIPD